MSSSSPTKSPKSSSDAALAGSDEEDEDPNPLPLSICCKIAFNDLFGKARDFNYVLRKKLESYMSATGSMVTLN